MNVTDCATVAPLTATDPNGGLALYPGTTPTVYGYVPFATVKRITVVVDDCVAPFNVTDQLIPDGNPLSVNVTAYVVAFTEENVTASETGLPDTVRLPDGGRTAYPGTEATVKKYTPFASAKPIVAVVELSVT